MSDSLAWITVNGRHIPLGNVGKFNPTSTNKNSSSKGKKADSPKLTSKELKVIEKKYNLSLRTTGSGREFVRMENKSTKKIDFIYNSDKEIIFFVGKDYVKTTGKILINKLKERK